MSVKSPSEFQLRELLCEVGRRVWQREYVAASDGNFSVRLSDGTLLCTPTMVSKGFMLPEEMVVVNPETGRVARGGGRATSEIRMHLEIYRRRPDVQAVVHAHPPHGTAFAIARRALPKCVLPEAELWLGELPVVPYETTGTQSFADALAPFVENADAFLLASHGAVTVGTDLLQAYYRMETVDQVCRVLLLAQQLGGWAEISSEKIHELLRLREKLGLRPDRRAGLPQHAVCEPGVPGEKGLIDEGQQRVIEAIVREVVGKLDEQQSGAK